MLRRPPRSSRTDNLLPYTTLFRSITTARDEFRAGVPTGGRLIGLDVGTKTIGLALCDARWTIASPAHTITRTKFTKDKAALAEFIAAQQVEGIVIGRPLNLDGGESPRSQSSRAFARNLADLGLPVLLWDDRSEEPTSELQSLLRTSSADSRLQTNKASQLIGVHIF